MQPVGQELLAAVDAELRMRGLQANRSPYLESKSIHYLLFHGFGDERRPPVSFMLSAERDDAETMMGFLEATPAVTRYGTATRVLLQGCAKADPAEIATMIEFAYRHCESGGATVGLEWIGEWLVFNPARRLTEVVDHGHLDLEALAAKVADRSGEAGAGAVPEEPERKPAVDLTTRRIGLIFEHRLAERLTESGFSFIRSDDLDRHLKTDFLLHRCRGLGGMRPIALQVTLRWNDLLKLRAFRAQHKRVSFRKRPAVRLYVQVQEGVTAERVAEVVREYAERRCRSLVGPSHNYVDVTPNGWWTFNANERIAWLTQRANQHATQRFRMDGTVVKVTGSGLLIGGDDGKRHWAYGSEIADPQLHGAWKEHLNGCSSIEARRVSFIPVVQDGKSRAQSVVLLRS